jgi:RNA exonuclease NGL2
MLTNELTHYQPTILCMQEVDLEQYALYFVKLLSTLNYDHVLLAAKKKRQGLLIAWKKAMYELIHRKDIHYDRLNAGSVGPTMWTGNVGLCLGLRRKDIPGRGIWVSNTHLYWHPRGSYERQRQAGILVSETISCSAAEPEWPVFICGGTVEVDSS